MVQAGQPACSFYAQFPSSLFLFLIGVARPSPLHSGIAPLSQAIHRRYSFSWLSRYRRNRAQRPHSFTSCTCMISLPRGLRTNSLSDFTATQRTSNPWATREPLHPFRHFTLAPHTHRRIPFSWLLSSSRNLVSCNHNHDPNLSDVPITRNLRYGH